MLRTDVEQASSRGISVETASSIAADRVRLSSAGGIVPLQERAVDDEGVGRAAEATPAPRRPGACSGGLARRLVRELHLHAGPIGFPTIRRSMFSPTVTLHSLCWRGASIDRFASRCRTYAQPPLHAERDLRRLVVNSAGSARCSSKPSAIVGEFRRDVGQRAEVLGVVGGRRSGGRSSRRPSVRAASSRIRVKSAQAMNPSGLAKIERSSPTERRTWSGISAGLFDRFDQSGRGGERISGLLGTTRVPHRPERRAGPSVKPVTRNVKTRSAPGALVSTVRSARRPPGDAPTATEQRPTGRSSPESADLARTRGR